MNVCAALLCLVQEVWFVVGRNGGPPREPLVRTEDTGALLPALLEAVVWTDFIQVTGTKVGSNYTTQKSQDSVPSVTSGNL